jgi:hypothetical protein
MGHQQVEAKAAQSKAAVGALVVAVVDEVGGGRRGAAAVEFLAGVAHG